MTKTKTKRIVFTLFVVYFLIRLFFALRSDYFNSDYSYFALRQVENIAESGLVDFEQLTNFWQL